MIFFKPQYKIDDINRALNRPSNTLANCAARSACAPALIKFDDVLTEGASTLIVLWQTTQAKI